jgi:hypothetical protein
LDEEINVTFKGGLGEEFNFIREAIMKWRIWSGVLIAVIFSGSFSVVAQNAPYVNAAVADTEFHRITSQNMDLLRTKKILFLSRSFGLNMLAGISSLTAANSMYNLLNSFVEYDIFSSGGDESVIPEDAFKNFNFIHVMCTASPYTARLTEFNNLLCNYPHFFADDADVAWMDFHSADSSTFGPYSALMDTLQAHYPHIKFIYVTAGLEGPSQVDLNNASAQFSTMIRTKYKGEVPLIDWGFELNNDSACGNNYCPSYSTDPADVHANTQFAQERVAKGFLVMLNKLFCENQSTCTSSNTPSVPTGLAGQAQSLHLIRLSWQASTQSPCGVDYYRIRRNSADVGISYGLAYSDHDLTENTQYSYQMAAVSKGGAVVSAYCTAIQVGTLNDNIPPRILAVPNTITGTEVTVEYSELVDSVTSLNPIHYAINGGVTVQSARYFGADSIVVLTTSALPPNVLCTLTINGVTDLSVNHNTIAANTRITFKYNSMSLTGNALGYWPFDGNALDTSGNNLNGAWTGTAVYGTGKVNQCLSENGTSGGGYVMAANNSLLNGMAQLTMSLWAKKKVASSGGDLLYKHVTYNMALSNTTVSGIIYNATGAQTGYSATVPSLNDTNWHHFCVVYDGATVTVYVDGARQNSVAQTGNLATQNYDLYFGKDPWGVSFNGYIDEVRLYSWAVDSNGVKQLRNLGLLNADSLAVRALLDANGLYSKQVGGGASGGVAVFDSITRRIKELYIQEGGITQITADIGQLTELTLLNCYGDRKQAYPLLISVSQSISKCTKLTQLLLNQNNLATLPVQITALKNLTNLSLGDNYLCNQPDTIKNWATKYDPDWASTQNCATILDRSLAGKLKRPFYITRNGSIITITRSASGTLMHAFMYDLAGHLVYSIQSCPGKTMVWNGSALESGIYLVKVVIEGMEYKCRVVQAK